MSAAWICIAKLIVASAIKARFPKQRAPELAASKDQAAFFLWGITAGKILEHWLMHETKPDVPSLLCIGYGNMGGALVDRWATSRPGGRVAILDSDQKARVRARSQGFEIIEPADVADFDLVLLGIKPQQLPELRLTLSGKVWRVGTVLSILTGASVEAIASLFPAGTRVVRAMPNLPARVGAGVTACFIPSKEGRLDAEAFFGPSGSVVWLEAETLFDAVTAVSGAGPAYVFYFMECLAAGARHLGLPQSIADGLALQTVVGASVLAAQSCDSPAKLRSDVASKGGTTAAALEILMAPDNGLGLLIARALDAAAYRSRELGAFGNVSS